MASKPQNPNSDDTASNVLLVIRSLIGGLLMGLANLVPGISGGTMLVAAGIYQRFINAIAELSTFKFRMRSILVLAVVVGSAAASIVLLVGPIKNMVLDHRWIMYSIFIGLTLGGVPVVWAMVGKPTRGLWTGAVAGFVCMTVLAIFQAYGNADGAARSGFMVMLVTGAIAAGAMILPGVSGGYLLLVLGVYIPVLTAIDQCKQAASTFSDSGFDAAWQAASTPLLTVVLPIGIGVVIGVVVISNLLKLLLARFEKPTLGVLLGLLIGAVVGLWPFQQAENPVNIRVVKSRQVMMIDAGLVYIDDKTEVVDPKDYPTVFFTPGAVHIGGAMGLIVAGFVATSLIAKLGKDKKPAATTMESST